MHETLISTVKGHIDYQNNFNFGTKDFKEIGGWFLSDEKITLRFITNENQVFEDYSEVDRSDVINYYPNGNLNCGFKVIVPDFSECKIQANIKGQWIDIFSIDNKDYIFKTTNDWKSVIVVDNFYENPDKVREFALSNEFQLNPSYHKGRRTNEVFRPKFLKEKFESLIGRKIKDWDYYGTNGCFQYCTSEDKLVYHYDGQNYAAVIYLTPDAPPESGTTLYRSKHNKLRKITNLDYSQKSFDEYQQETFPTGFYDSTQFEVVDVIGNVYNRLVLWDAKLIHAASSYFGNNLQNSRLFHLFFFDIE